MDFKRLRILRELADRGTVGATAEAMSVTPSAVSQQLKTLQDELGVVLVEKSGRGVRLTEAGLAMAGAAAEVSTAMARAEATIDTYRRGWQTHVKAAFFPSAAEMFLPGLLHRVKAIDGLRFPAAHRPEPARSNLGTLHQSFQFAPGDVRIDGVQRRKAGEAAVRAGDHPLSSDYVGVAFDALCDNFRMFDIVGAGIDHARN